MKTIVMIFLLVFCAASIAAAPPADKPERSATVNRRILDVRVDACAALLKGIVSLPADDSFHLCVEAFRIADSAKVSELLRKPEVAKVLVKDSLFDAGRYQFLPVPPGRGETVYMLKLPNWTGTGFAIYLYFRQQSPGYVSLHSESKDILVRAIPSDGSIPTSKD